MTAELLREAARVLRERAENATPGPWQPKAGMVSCVLGPREPEDHGGGLSSILRANLPMINGQERRQANVTYAATVHPGVGLALADLLDTAAERVAEIARTLPEGSRQLDGVLLHNVTGYTPALNIARAILGESADDVLDPALDGTAAGAQCPPGQEEAWSREFGACPKCKATWPNLHVYTRNPQAVLCMKCGWAA